MIVGAEGGSYAMLRYLVEKITSNGMPKNGFKSTTQPIAVDNVVDYLVGVMKNPITAGKILEIGGPDKMTYEQMMRLYSSIINRKSQHYTNTIFWTPRLSSYWIDLVTPVKASLARPLVDSLVHDSYVKDNTIQELVPVNLKHMTEAIKEARDEAIAFKPIQKTPEEKTSYKVNQKLLLISLCAMALIGSTYYWMDERTDVWEISWLFGSLIWYAAIIFCNIICKTKSKTWVSYWGSVIMGYNGILVI